MMIIALGTVSGLLQERFWDYYENGFGIITRTVSDDYGNGFNIITGTLLEQFEDVWERFVVTMQDGHRYGTVLILIERFWNL